MLVGADGVDLGLCAFLQGGQAAGVILALIAFSALLLLVAAFLIDGQEAVEGDHLAGCAQAGLAVRGFDLDRGAVQTRGLHLRSDHPLPDQFVQTLKVRIEPHGFRQTGDIGGPDRFVRFLSVLGLDLVEARFGRDIGGAVFLADDLARLGQALGADRNAVGPHIGDQAAGFVDAFIQFLRRLHGALGGEAQLARGFLLQGRGGEGGRRIAPDRLLLDRVDGEVAGLDRGARGVGGRFVLDVQTLHALAGVFDQTGGEGRAVGVQVGLDGPVFLRLELLDLHFAINDDAKGDRLHPSGRTRARQLAPQDRRQGEAHQIVQRAAGQIGLDQLHVDLARVGHGVQHSGLGDGVEGDALDVRVLQHLLLVQNFQNVPADRFPFAVGVGRKDDAVGALGGLGDFGQAFGALGVRLPVHGEVVVGQDRAILGRQVADVAVRGQDLIARAQILVDGLGLCGALDDDEVHIGPVSGRGANVVGAEP